MKWSKPKVTSLSMNAEIGAYQNDFDGDYPPFVSDAEFARDTVRGAEEADRTTSRRDTSK